MKKALALFLAWSLVFSTPAVMVADDSDIFGSTVQPNVMILLDSSGSMNNEISPTLLAYNPSTTYPGSFDSGVVYNRRGNSYRVYAASIADVPSWSARQALLNSGFWSGRIGGSRVRLYVGNYLNYLACSACQGAEKKIDIAKRVISNLITNTEGVRFGVMRFKDNAFPGTGGAGMVAPIGTDKVAMVDAIKLINPSGYTPLGEQLRDAGLYYKGLFESYASPIQIDCQPNFVIIVSDGLQNGSVDVRTEATNRFTQDHAAAFTGTQNVIVHTVGFAIDAGEQAAANDVLQTAATNGGGTFYYSEDSTQLEQALQDAISQIIAASFSFSNPVIPTTGTTGSTKAYRAAFQSDPVRGFWRGFLKAYQRDSNGQIPVDANGIPLDSALVWEAGAQLALKSSGSRTIYTAISGGRESFTKSNSNITQSMLGVLTAADRDMVIDFIRGIDAYDEDGDGNTTEERAWKLGDIFHSVPVLVSPPFGPSVDSSYNNFKQTNANRPTVLIAGANDGMLHGFRESDGEELWGFIPPEVLGRLQKLPLRSPQHEYYVDSSPIVADVKVGGTWKTILVFGLRRGGRSYYALDITDPTDPLYLWSFTDSKVGETWSEPAIGRVKMADGTEKFVAFVGGGYDTAQNNYTGYAFYAIDLSNGAKLWEYWNAPSTNNDERYMNFSLAANPTAVDINGDGYVDRVYIGDVGGQMWKFDVSAAATLSSGLVTNWTGKRLFTASPAQPNPPLPGEYYPEQGIYVAPILSLDLTGNLWLYFGTGDRNHPNNTSFNRFYGIKDDTTMVNDNALTESSLTDVTLGTGTVTQGWYIILNANEKVLSSADVFNKNVFFTTYTPSSTLSCASGGGSAKLYAVNMLQGDASLNLATAQALSSGQSALAWAKDVGSGIPSKPVVILGSGTGSQGAPLMITGTTNQQIITTPVPPIALKRLIAWREVF